jgi:hypothetical protein
MPRLGGGAAGRRRGEATGETTSREATGRRGEKTGTRGEATGRGQWRGGAPGRGRRRRAQRPARRRCVGMSEDDDRREDDERIGASCFQGLVGQVWEPDQNRSLDERLAGVQFWRWALKFWSRASFRRWAGVALMPIMMVLCCAHNDGALFRNSPCWVLLWPPKHFGLSGEDLPYSFMNR